MHVNDIILPLLLIGSLFAGMAMTYRNAGRDYRKAIGAAVVAGVAQCVLLAAAVWIANMEADPQWLRLIVFWAIVLSMLPMLYCLGMAVVLIFRRGWRLKALLAVALGMLPVLLFPLASIISKAI